MASALISFPIHAKDMNRLPPTTIPSTTALAVSTIPATKTASANSTSSKSGSGSIYESGGALNSCAQSFLIPKPYNWHAYRNVCSDAIHITFKPKAAPLGSRTSAMDLTPGQSSTTGYSTSDTPQGLLAGVCYKDFVPVDAQNKMWEAVEGINFRCMKVSGAPLQVSEATSPQKKSDDQLSPSQGSTRVQNQQKIDAPKEPERIARIEQKQRQTEKLQQQETARQANTENGDTVIAGKSFSPQPASNSYEIEKIGKGFVVALDCNKNVRGALQVVAEIGDPPNAVVFKNISSRDIFLVAGARRVDGYGSEALTLQPGKEHKIVQLKVDRNYDYGEWYAVYSDKVATQPIDRNSETSSADQAHCLSRVNEIIKSFW